MSSYGLIVRSKYINRLNPKFKMVSEFIQDSYWNTCYQVKQDRIDKYNNQNKIVVAT